VYNLSVNNIKIAESSVGLY